MKYPVSETLKTAIDSLFENASTGYDVVGARRIMPPDWYQEGKSENIPILERAKMLRKKLEENVSNMAAESEEYGCEEETKRLRSETIAMLIALRELFLHLPEAFEN